jgi:CRP-like cAMP-binding protein
MADVETGLAKGRPLADSPVLRAAVSRVATRIVLPTGAVLFQKGDPAESFYLLDEGQIEISVMSAGGKKLSLEVMAAPDAFGEIGMFAGVRSADARAISDCRLMVARRSDLMPLIRAEPSIALLMIELLCARLHSVNEKLEERSFLPLPTRLARRLLHLSEKYDGAEGAIPLSQAELADFAGATREAVAKTLAQWRSQGWIDLSRGALRLANRGALEAVAAQDDD